MDGADFGQAAALACVVVGVVALLGIIAQELAWRW